MATPKQDPSSPTLPLPPPPLGSDSLRQEVWINRVERSKIFAQRDAQRRCGHMFAQTTALITPFRGRAAAWVVPADPADPADPRRASPLSLPPQPFREEGGDGKLREFILEYRK